MYRQCISGFLALLCAAVVLLAQETMAAAPKVGEIAPNFTLRSNQGKNVRLSDLRGQVVLVNFWATWCGPCRQEMPLLDKLHDQYRKVGFTLLGISIDQDKRQAAGMARSLGVRFPILYDDDQRVSRVYDLRGMPSTFVVDRNGRIRHVHIGYKQGYEHDYQQQVRALLKE
jgi:peroxiredoxin